MLIGKTRLVATIVTLALLPAAAGAADTSETAAEARARAAAVNRDLARIAHTAAVEDAIEAVLADNKAHLDIRIIGRTSGHASGKTAHSR